MTAAEEKAIDRALRGIDRPRQMIPDPADALDHPTIRVLHHLAATSGVTPAARPYLIRRMRWHLGRCANLPICPSEHRDLADWLKRRAYELVDEHRRQLPPLLDERNLA